MVCYQPLPLVTLRVMSRIIEESANVIFLPHGPFCNKHKLEFIISEKRFILFQIVETNFQTVDTEHLIEDRIVHVDRPKSMLRQTMYRIDRLIARIE